MKRSFTKFETRLRAVALHADVEKRALAHNVTLRELYEGPDRAWSVSAARTAVYAWLSKRGKGIREIARLFDRSANGVVKKLKNGGGR